MKKRKILYQILFILLISLSACNKDDPTDELPDNTDEFDGYITFFTKTTGDNCGDIPISLNGTSIGTLTGTVGSNPVCGADNSAGVITIGVNVGAHDYAASDNCNNIWTGTIIINRGDCKTKEFSR